MDFAEDCELGQPSLEEERPLRRLQRLQSVRKDGSHPMHTATEESELAESADGSIARGAARAVGLDKMCLLMEVRTAEHLGRLALRHLPFQVWPQHHTLLLVRVSPRQDEDGWRLAAIDRHMGHSRRDVQVVAGVGDLSMF
jgi:hypothetical protein